MYLLYITGLRKRARSTNEVTIGMQTLAKATACAILIALVGTSVAFAAGNCCNSGTACCSVAAAKDPDNTLTDQEKQQGFSLLFDGKTLDGWDCTEAGSKGWALDNGAILHNLQGGGYLYTKERFGDFELKIDFMVDHGTNSGVFFRWDRLGNPVQTGIEMQVLDSAGHNPPDKHDCGAIYDVLAPSENAMKPALEWNTAIIKCRDSFVSVTLNGKSIIRTDLSKYKQPHRNIDGTRNKFRTPYADMPREGYIGLQSHTGKVWYKNIRVRKL